MNTKTNKVKFLRSWILLNAAFFVIAYILVAILGILIMEAMHLPKDEWGSPLQQTIWKIGEGIIIGSSIGFIQWKLLRKTYKIPSFWMFTVPAGIIFTELMAGIILMKMGINRGEYSFWENNPLPHTLIAAIYGLVIGLIQSIVLWKQLAKRLFWIIASTLAWGLSILVTAINVTSDIFLLINFIIGILLYGVITGVVLVKILKPR